MANAITRMHWAAAKARRHPRYAAHYVRRPKRYVLGVRISGIVQQSVTPTDDTLIDGVIQGSVEIKSPANVDLRGSIQGSTTVESGARLVITGAQQGSVTVRPGAHVLVEPTGKLTGSLWNDGQVVVRGVFAGSQAGMAQIELEGAGWIRPPDEILPDGTHVYRW